ncbi:MAG: DEAD/DEAH box helicase [Desulfobacterales bacterium]|nr:DEAD/DEAH box helicase [Desulfobacterales bacterium]
MNPGLDSFHPLIREWFAANIGRPTDVQSEAWPAIGRREHLLVTAPTGSGKTLTAFLWAINQLATGAWSPGRVRVLYISPLKALNNDIRKNLIRPLARIREKFEDAGEIFPSIRVLTRSGDTPQKDRRKMSIHPPEILITTPESLNLLLSSASGCAILGSLKTVILDEIHACAGNKRGVHLITAVDRLVRLSGEFQRIALSATLENLDPVAEMVGGYRFSGSIHAPEYFPRPVTRIASGIQKEYRLKICYPERSEPEEMPEDTEEDFSVWDLLAESFRERIEKNRSTLLFTNGRRLCEKLTYKVNRAAGGLLAYSHHGSLSKDLRKDVEERLREGGLKAIVATSSLEMGIDIGDLDEVILVQSPFSVSSAVQRLGRAGHQVGRASAGRLFPSHAQDLIASAVLARAISKRDIEPLYPVKSPLDVLAQILISMVGRENWDVDELYAFIRTSAPYRDLGREQFDLVLNMLEGRYAGTRIRDLQPRISFDRLENTVSIKKGATLALYMSGGTIPDRGYYQLRHSRTNARIGELDEEYVWEAKVGQIATVGSQNWKITRITHNDVFALPAGNRGMDAPFWIAEGLNRDFHFSSRMAGFLEQADQALSGGPEARDAFAGELTSTYCMDDTGARELIKFCRSQKEVAPLPHRRHLLLEYVRSGPGASPGTMLVIHTLWGGRVNRPFALALEAAWTEHFKERPEIFPGNDAVIVQLPGPVEPEELLSLVTADNLEQLVCSRLESSGFFGARFRECAGRALLVTRNRINQRMPLWMTRLQSQKLMENILSFPDFPILLETWRTCLRDEFDMPALGMVLEELASGEISWSAAHTARPSPFAAAMAWNQINQYMYREDQPASAGSGLKDNLIKEALYTAGLRPKISPELARTFEIKRQRLAPGYGPDNPGDLCDWVKDRVAIPVGEWKILSRALADSSGDQAEVLLNNTGEKLVLVTSRGATYVAARESVKDILAGWYGPGNFPELTDMGGKDPDIIPAEGRDPELGLALFAQWLSYYSPKPPGFCLSCLGLSEDTLSGFISDLVETKAVVQGQLLVDGRDGDICDARNLEILIRMHRAAGRPGFDPLDLDLLPLFLAECQGLTGRDREGQGRGDALDHLFDSLEQLACLPLPAGLWETDVLPARIEGYHPSFLDSLMQEGEILWLGRQKERVLFCFEPDLDFLKASEDEGSRAGDDPGTGVWKTVFKEPDSRYDFFALQRLVNGQSRDLINKIWDRVWQGKLTNTTFLALRKGIENRFKLPESPGQLKGSALRSGRGRYRGRRRAAATAGVGFSRTELARRQGALPLAGQWFQPAADAPAKNRDLVEAEALNRDRVRVLLDRYGILFRELLARELPGFRWKDLFKSLYLMELSGEVLAGSFFKGIQGPQFVSHKAFRRLSKGLDTGTVYWMNAMDPASICGLGPMVRGLGLPKRLAGTHLVYRGRELVLVSGRRGREMTIHVPPEDDRLPGYLAPVVHMMTRTFSPLTHITVDTINGESAAQSPYRGAFDALFEVVAGHKSLDLYQRRDHDTKG